MLEVLFDVDGVLVHLWGFRNRLASEYGIGPETTRDFFSGPFQDCATGKRELADVLPPYLAGWGFTEGPDALIDFWMKSDDAPNLEVLEFVRGLRSRGIRCHVASNQEHTRARYLSNEMGFARRFDELLFSCDLGAAKPDPEFFRRAAHRLGRSGSQLMLVDDAPRNVEMARAAGWQAILYDDPRALEQIESVALGPSTRNSSTLTPPR